jgi:metallophosphoesterase (TIGR00282 family)
MYVSLFACFKEVKMDILFIGDIVGKLGREVVNKMIDEITSSRPIDFIIANGENATHGKGLIESHFNYLVDSGIDVVTLGNHYAAKREIFKYIDSYDNLIRPSNLHDSIPGVGTNIFNCNGVKIRVTNMLGRVYMSDLVKNPFDDLQRIINEEEKADIHIVDFHAEATGEKYALAYAFDGQISALIGTHTHVQTADARILEKGTGYMSDVGMCGPYNGILGTRKEDVINKSWTGIPTVFNTVEEDDAVFSAVILKFDDGTNECIGLEPVYKVVSYQDLNDDDEEEE